jgi:hypothetical protein
MNWLEFLDKIAWPAMRRLVRRCLKYGARCASWSKRKGPIEREERRTEQQILDFDAR